MKSMLERSPRAGAPRRPWSTSKRLTSCLLTVLCACMCATLMAGVSAASAKATRRSSTAIKPTQQLAVLDYEHRAYQYPRTNAKLKASIPAERPITGERTTLPVVGESINRHGQRWLKVMVPGRPNSSTAWIKRAGTFEASTSWNIQVNLASRSVWVYHRGRLTRKFSAVVGKPSTPTPTGHFFVEETVIMPTSEAGGPYALALSGRSDVLHQFAGGPGEIAIHGRDDLGGTPGQAQSHGCIRLITADITWLISRIVPGTPVTIR